MKNYFIFLALILAVSACKKGTVELESTEIGIDPVGNRDALNRSIQLKGHFKEGNLPRKQAGAPLEIVMIAPRDTVEIGDETPAFIPLTVLDQGFFKLCGMNMKVEGASGYWQVYPVTDSVSSEYFVALVVPRLTRPGNFRVWFTAELCFRGQTIVTDSVPVFLEIRPTLNCTDTLRGSAGLTIRRFYMGEKAGRVNLKLATGTIGDRMDIKHGGKYILSTCDLPKPWQYPKCSESYRCFPVINYFKDFYFDYDPKNGRYIELYMMGFCENPQTVWRVRMGCPQ